MSLSLVFHIVAFNLNILIYVLWLVEIAIVFALVLLGIDMAYYLYKGWSTEKKRDKNEQAVTQALYELEVELLKKEEKRRQKEETADGGFFEESFVNGFDQTGELIYRGEHRYPTDEDDRQRDDTIFENTEDF